MNPSTTVADYFKFRIGANFDFEPANELDDCELMSYCGLRCKDWIDWAHDTIIKLDGQWDSLHVETVLSIANDQCTIICVG